MLIWLISTAAVCILLGAILTLWVEWHLLSQPVRSHRLAHDDNELQIDADSSIELPEVPLLQAKRLYKNRVFDLLSPDHAYHVIVTQQTPALISSLPKLMNY